MFIGKESIIKMTGAVFLGRRVPFLYKKIEKLMQKTIKHFVIILVGIKSNKSYKNSYK